MVENDNEKIRKRIKKMSKNNLRLINIDRTETKDHMRN